MKIERKHAKKKTNKELAIERAHSTICNIVNEMAIREMAVSKTDYLLIFGHRFQTEHWAWKMGVLE